MEKVYGYARVSTTHQNTDRQISVLREFGIDERSIVVDKASGKIYYYDTIKTKIMIDTFDGNEYVNMPSILKNCDHIVDTLYAPKHRPYFLTEEEEEYL